MAETRRKFDRDFREGAVRLVRETGKPIAQVARELGIHDGTLGNWVNADRRRRGDGGNGVLSEDERAELVRLRREKNAEAGNREFTEKKQSYFTSRSGTSPFAVTTQVLNEPVWTPDVLRDRQAMLLAHLRELWRL